MATTVITGRDVTFTIGGNNFDAQATSAVLSNSPTMVRYQTLDGVVNRRGNRWVVRSLDAVEEQSHRPAVVDRRGR